MRERLIIDILKEKENVLSKTLALKLEVSDRTIRSEISSLNKIGRISGFKIINVRGRGYTLVIDECEKFNKYVDKLDKSITCDFNLEERTNKILEIFLIENKYITIDYICGKIGYSRKTISKDLDVVEEKLKNLNLKLKRRISLGLKIEGDEVSIRKALSSYLYSNNRDLLINNKKNLQTFGLIKKIFVEEIVSEKIKINNVGIENIFYHLKILILRFSNGSFIEEWNHKECLDERFKIISLKICNCVKEILKIDIPEKEIEYLAAQMFYKSNVMVQEDDIRNKAKKDIQEILENIDVIRYTSFSKDEELKNNLLIHLCALINRVRSNTQLKNPYFDEVNTRYSAIVSITVSFTEEFCKRWDMILLKDEIAFIAIHFATHFEKVRLKKLQDIKRIAVICQSNGGIEYFIKIRLEEAFRDVIIDCYSPIDLNKLKEHKYDFVITSVDLETALNCSIFKINNIFDKDELEQIVKKVEQSIEGEKEKLEEVFFKKKKGGAGVNYKKFLKEEAEKLIELGIVRKDFEKLVLQREEKLSTAYKNNIAAPHGIEMNARKNSISVTIFDNNIQWGDKKVDIVILIAMKEKCLDLHRIIASKLFYLTNNEVAREKIRKCKNDEEFKNVFEDI